jgi:hypothetical protein
MENVRTQEQYMIVGKNMRGETVYYAIGDEEEGLKGKWVKDYTTALLFDSDVEAGEYLIKEVLFFLKVEECDESYELCIPDEMNMLVANETIHIEKLKIEISNVENEAIESYKENIRNMCRKYDDMIKTYDKDYDRIMCIVGTFKE